MTYKPLGVFRTILALTVLAQHVRVVGPEWMNHGTLWIGSAAVLGFFGLSGLVITEAAESFYAKRPVPFGVNRAIRILPQLFLAMILSIGVHLAMGGAAFPNGFVKVGYDVMFSASNLIKNVFSILPAINPDYGFVPYTWALEIEVMFYAVLFFGLMASLKVDMKIVRRCMLAFGTVLFVWWCFGGPSVFDYPPFFIYGASVYWMLRDRKWTATAVAVLSYIACVYVCLTIWATDPGRFVWTALVAVFLALIPVLSAIKVGPKLRHIDRKIGDLSYPIYLQQYAVILAVYAFAPKAYWSIGLVFVLAILAGWLSDRTLERSIVSIRNRIRGRSLEDVELGTTAAP